MDYLDWFLNGLASEYVIRLLAYSYLSNIIFWPLGYIFSFFKTKMQATLFLILTPLFIFLMLLAFSSANMSQPNLHAEVLRSVYGGSTPDKQVTNIIALGLRVSNRGSMRSAILGWQLFVNVDGDMQKATVLHSPKEIDLYSAEAEHITLTKESLMTTKTNPIEPGAYVTGYLLANVPQLSDGALRNKLPTFIVKFIDATGREYTIESKTKSKKYVKDYIPGID
jgi:hypothetical protein